ncbi:MAG: hypothetical protein ACE3JP_14145 [Ectobacillus sp.]
MDEETNRCLIYENRPLLCNIEQVYKELFSVHFTVEEYYAWNVHACNELQEANGIGGSFRVYMRGIEKIKIMNHEKGRLLPPFSECDVNSTIIYCIIVVE